MSETDTETPTTLPSTYTGSLLDMNRLLDDDGLVGSLSGAYALTPLRPRAETAKT
ncbi:MAG: hypothetical protein ACYDCK_12345 [Thermoplasmatota archaeon]